MAKFPKLNVPFTQVANEVLVNKKLSLKAKGLFAYLYSKPDDWNFAYDRITSEQLDGKRVVLSALKELEVQGYLTRKKLGTGRVEYYLKYQVNPDAENEHQALEPSAQNRKLLKPQVAKTSTISNTDKDSNTKEESNRESDGQAVAEILYQFEKVNPAIKRMYGNKTQRSAAERLIATFGFDVARRGAEAAVGVLGMPFAPRITTPYELELSWAKLVAFVREQKNKSNKNKVYTL